MYGCESWTIKKAECQRIDVFELWCWRRLLRVPWTIGRSNQSILKEINLNIHLKDRCWSWSANTLAIWCKELTHYKDSRKDWGQEKGATEVEMVDGITDLMDLSLSKLRYIMKDKKAWSAAVHGVAKSQTRLSSWTTTKHIRLAPDSELLHLPFPCLKHSFQDICMVHPLTHFTYLAASSLSFIMWDLSAWCTDCLVVAWA